ncbi:hypothetical protein K438DRAFT_685503 [Mycena galopus ATCC 62051]|nr:hypothetical protein K438DRAFT_685503 [Mycena galopus ATCC 62051]
MLRRQGAVTSPRKRKNPTPESDVSNSDDSEAGGSDAEVVSGSKKLQKKDGWVWLERMTGREGQSDKKVQQYKLESDRIQWFRAEVEMYRWCEQYERKHTELMRVMTRFARDGEVWTKRANHLEEMDVKPMGAATYAREQVAMCRRLEHNSRVTFKDVMSVAHKEWATAAMLNDLVVKIDASHEEDFKWMDDLRLWVM